MVDMTTYIKPSSTIAYVYTPYGWTAETWKLDLSKTGSEWVPDSKIKVSEVPVNNTPYAQMLPVPQKGEDKESILMSLHAEYPALSLHDDGVVYIMNRRERDENFAWVIAVDIKHRNLKDVAFYNSGRPVGAGFNHLVSGISKHLGGRSFTRSALNAAETSRNGMAQRGKEVTSNFAQPQPSFKGRRRPGRGRRTCPPPT
ncbi:hypothetical protein ACP70R_006115 [Stipagrostis hirtigluma subsp. patula]